MLGSVGSLARSSSRDRILLAVSVGISGKISLILPAGMVVLAVLLMISRNFFSAT